MQTEGKFTHRSKNARRYSRHSTGTTWVSIFLMTFLSLTFGNISFAVLVRGIASFVSDSSWTDERPLGESKGNRDAQCEIPSNEGIVTTFVVLAVIRHGGERGIGKRGPVPQRQLLYLDQLPTTRAKRSEFMTSRAGNSNSLFAASIDQRCGVNPRDQAPRLGSPVKAGLLTNRNISTGKSVALCPITPGDFDPLLRVSCVSFPSRLK